MHEGKGYVIATTKELLRNEFEIPTEQIRHAIKIERMRIGNDFIDMRTRLGKVECALKNDESDVRGRIQAAYFLEHRRSTDQISPPPREL